MNRTSFNNEAKYSEGTPPTQPAFTRETETRQQNELGQNRQFAEGARTADWEPKLRDYSFNFKVVMKKRKLGKK